MGVRPKQGKMRFWAIRHGTCLEGQSERQERRSEYKVIMHKSIFLLLILAPATVACAGSLPPPTQRLADAQSAERSARELGANDQPAAQLSLELAQDQISKAQVAMEQGDNERANSLLLRAQADAELAVAQARETGAKVEKQEAIEEKKEQDQMNAIQGAVK
jgi:hypothetical protein